MRLDQAKRVEYQFEEAQHAQTFAKFQSRVLDCFSQETESQRALFLLNLLIENKSQILNLPISIKQADCTIARFYLLLMPLFNAAETGNYKETKQLAANFISLLLGSEYSVQIKINCLVQLYNSVLTESGIKSYAFEQLL